MTQTDFSFVSGLVRQRSAIDLQPGKEYLVESRLAAIARQYGERDVAALVGRLRLRAGDDALSEAVVDALTTNETSWFRDTHPFDAFTSTMLPQVAGQAAARGEPVTVWSAACSSGQEAYSLAMLSLDWTAAHPGSGVRIVGTDISASMIERARAGCYSQLEVSRGLPASYLHRYFERVGPDWQLSQQVRALTRFERGNLALPATGIPTCDVVFLRNVLIYFDVPTKRAVLHNVRRLLRPGGFLVLGAAESALSLDDSFVRVEMERVVLFRNGPART